MHVLTSPLDLSLCITSRGLLFLCVCESFKIQALERVPEASQVDELQNLNAFLLARLESTQLNAPGLDSSLRHAWASSRATPEPTGPSVSVLVCPCRWWRVLWTWSICGAFFPLYCLSPLDLSSFICHCLNEPKNPLILILHNHTHRVNGGLDCLLPSSCFQSKASRGCSCLPPFLCSRPTCVPSKTC